jgi:hypothetical protein
MDDLSGKINDLLSDPESMEKIKNLAGMLAGSSTGEKESGDSQAGHNEENNSDGLNIDPEMLLKITSALKLMNKNDPRVDFLLALKKNLSNPRQRKVDDAIHILRLLSIMPMLREQGIF